MALPSQATQRLRRNVREHEPWTRASAARRPARPLPRVAPEPPCGAPPPPPPTSGAKAPTSISERNNANRARTLNTARSKDGRGTWPASRSSSRAPRSLSCEWDTRRMVRAKNARQGGRRESYPEKAELGDEGEELQLQLRQRRRLSLLHGAAGRRG
jgi:hypothetical protein